jgi:Rv2632c-like
MQFELTPEQLSEIATVIDATLRDMSYEIAATDNSQFRAHLVGRRNLLRTVADALPADGGDNQPNRPNARMGPSNERVWTVEVVFTEDEDQTRADARMLGGQSEWHGWGRARRNPADANVRLIGEELAAARALSDLSHQIIDSASHTIETHEGEPVHRYP